ncbi:hypothetical protein [Azospirillum sp.]|uniref:hypothetical protein n=1 Tax=Azospirillum sp. TaxID=34012 RepID=UPI003D73AD37
MTKSFRTKSRGTRRGDLSHVVNVVMAQALRSGKRHRISRAAQAEIAERVLAARLPVLADLTAIVQVRGGQLTDPQIGAIAALLSHLVHCDILAETITDWLREAGAQPGTAEAWLQSPAGHDCLARARAAQDDHLVEVRRDHSIKSLKLIFAITDHEAESLSLAKLIPERMRSRLRRRAEGSRPAAEHATTRPEHPRERQVAEAPRSTHYRKMAKDEVDKAVAAVRQAAGTASAEPGAKPWEDLGISRATWFRRQRAAGETKYETPSDPIAYARDISFIHTVAPSLTRSLTSPTQPPKSAFPTSEARQLAALADRHGRRWSGGAKGWHEPESWFDPPDRPMADQDQAEYEAAVAAARRAEWRRQGVHTSRARKAAGVLSVPHIPTASPDPCSCPKRVTPAVWEAVPVPLRQRVRRLTGRFFAQGEGPDAAVARAVEAVRRMDAIYVRVMDAAPDANPDRVRCEADARWRQATDVAVEAILAVLAADREAAAHEAEVQAAAMERAAHLLSKAQPPIPAYWWEATLVAAARLLRERPRLGVAELAPTALAQATAGSATSSP